MAALFRPMDIILSPSGAAQRLRHDGIVAGGKGESGASKFRPRLPSIPVHQPAKPLIEPCNVERPDRGKPLRAAAAPEGLESLTWVVAKSSAHAGNPQGRNIRAEAIEALDADETAEWRAARLACPVQQPKDSKGMTHGDGIAWPGIRPLRSSGDEAEIDKADLRNTHKSDQIAPNRGIESPTMDEHEMHGRESAYPNALQRSAGVSSALSKPSTSASVWAAVKASLSLALPAGTVGGLIAVAK